MTIVDQRLEAYASSSSSHLHDDDGDDDDNDEISGLLANVGGEGGGCDGHTATRKESGRRYPLPSATTIKGIVVRNKIHWVLLMLGCIILVYMVAETEQFSNEDPLDASDKIEFPAPPVTTATIVPSVQSGQQPLINDTSSLQEDVVRNDDDSEIPVNGTTTVMPHEESNRNQPAPSEMDGAIEKNPPPMGTETISPVMNDATEIPTTSTVPLQQGTEQNIAETNNLDPDGKTSIPSDTGQSKDSNLASSSSTEGDQKDATSTAKQSSSTSTGTGSSNKNTLQDVDPSLFLPHLPFGPQELQYRRVCAVVHSSLLCLILRFPFPVQPQDPQYSYPHPVDERFYTLEKRARFIDGDNLHYCIQNITATTIDQRSKLCLDWYSSQGMENTVVNVWTRQRLVRAPQDTKAPPETTELYGVEKNAEQKQRITRFFDRQIVLTLGASPAPAVLACMASLFTGCKGGGIKPVSFLCDGVKDRRRIQQQSPVQSSRRRLGNTRDVPTLPFDETFLGIQSWYMTDNGHGRAHYLPGKNLTDTYKEGDWFRRPAGYKELRKLTLIIEYPIAHAQHQGMILNQWEHVVSLQKGFPALTLHPMTVEGQQILFDLGYELERIIVFDGMPQSFPTETGSYDFGIPGSQASFIEKNGYPGWKPEYGTVCRGPLPPNSKLTQVNSLSRDAFEELGFDMRFYGRTWEFGNQFWFHVRMWSGKGGALDCTHSDASRYFMMAMVDDYYDNLEAGIA